MTFRDKFPKNQYPFSDELCDFMDNNPEFFCSLKLSNSSRFKFIPLIFTSHTPNNHTKHKDEVIGMWYLDTSKNICNYHSRICFFKQDFVVNIGKRNKEFVSYSADIESGKYVKPISEFFRIYGSGGKFYHDGKEWQHHYADISSLPDEPRLREWAQKIKRELLANQISQTKKI